MCRIYAMLRCYSNKKTPLHLQVFKNKSYDKIGHFLAISEWILLNHVNNTLPENALIKVKIKINFKLIDISIFIFSFPLFILRILLNYFLLRITMLKIWYKLIFLKEKINITELN